MKIAMVFQALLIIAPLTAYGDGWATKLFAGKTEHDFGTVPRGAQLRHRFELTNIYAVPMEITQVRTSCGCATATASKTKLESRETGYIDVLMDGRRFNGKKSLTVFVSVGPKFVSTAELKISAMSRGDVVLNPGEVSFGVVSPASGPTKAIDIEYAGRLDWKITDVVAKDTPYEVSLSELYRRNAPQGTKQVGYRLSVTMKKDAPSGSLNHDVIIKTNDEANPTFPILVEATVQSTLSVIPSELKLGQVRVNELMVKRVIVRGKVPFQVTAVDGTGEGVSVVSIRPNSERTLHTITIHVQSPKQGVLTRELSIKTDLQKEPVLVKLEGEIVN